MLSHARLSFDSQERSSPHSFPSGQNNTASRSFRVQAVTEANDMKRVGFVTTAVLLCFLGGIAPANAQQEERGDKQDKTEKQNRGNKQQGKQ
jgi:hypothetical protein